MTSTGTQPAPDDRRWWLWRLGQWAAWHVGYPTPAARRHPALEMVSVMAAPAPDSEEER